MDCEHIYPVWSHDLLGKEKRKGVKAIIDETVSPRVRIQGKLKGSTLDHKVCCVCKTCNNGWMSRLETAAQPILTPLIDEQRDEPRSISTEEQSTIAAWLYLRFVVNQFDGSNNVTTEQAERRYFMEKQLPPPNNYRIFMGRYDVHRKSHIAITPLAHDPKRIEAKPIGSKPGRSKPVGPDTPDSFPFAFGGLFFQLVGGPRWLQIRELAWPDEISEKLLQIWPPSSTSLSWPPSVLTDEDVSKIALHYCAWVRDRCRDRGGRS
jgi:hypothetical protein